MIAQFRTMSSCRSGAHETAAAVWRCSAAAALGMLIALAWVSSAPAQSSDVQSLSEEIKRLQRELNTLQRYVYRGEQPPASAITEVYGTEGAVSQTQAARLELRVSQIEAALRELTGSMEERSYRIDRLNKRMDKLVADVDLRLRRLEERTGGRPVAPVAGTGTGQEMQAAGGGEPGTLGTVSEDAVAAVRTQTVEQGSATQAATPPSAGTQAYAIPGATPEDKYNYAFSLLSQANYEEAARALRAFIDQHPSHRLAGNAKYWLGETHYVRGQYHDAAITFAEGYQQYPTSKKAPDNLLKLGKSLAALGETTDACGTYSELTRRFPNASATILQQADQERRRLACP